MKRARMWDDTFGSVVAYAGAHTAEKGENFGADPMSVTIYHNPKCGTSRNVLAMIRGSGTEPVVIEYLERSAEPRAA